MTSDDRDLSVLSKFLSLEDGKDCFRFFSRSGTNPGVYVLGWWATYTAVEYIKSETLLKSWMVEGKAGAEPTTIPVVVLNDTLCKEVIADCLLRRGATVEFYDKNIRGVYECVQRGSPGNITDFEATLFEQEEVAIQLMATGSLTFSTGTSTEGAVHVGLAALNFTLRTISVAEYWDSVQLVNLDVLLSQLNIKELTVTLGGGSGKGAGRSSTELAEEGSLKEQIQAVQRICDRLRINIKVQGAAAVRRGGADGVTIDALKDLLRVPEDRLRLLDLPLGSRALEIMLQEIDLVDPNSQRTFYLKHVLPSTYMKLDSAAVEALHLFSVRPDAKGAAPTSIFGWLNRCTTGMGSRLMRQWIVQPLRSASDIAQRQSMVQLFLDHTSLKDALVTEVLSKCGDMDRMNRKLMRRRLVLKDMKSLLQFVDVLPVCVRVLQMANGSGAPQAKVLMDEYIAPLEEMTDHMKNLRILIESSVDFSESAVPRMNPAFDDALQEVHEQLTVTKAAMEKEFSLVIRKNEWMEKVKMKLEYHNTYGYVFRVPGKDVRQLRANKEFITLSTSKDGVRFCTDSLSALSSQYKSLAAEYDQRQEALRKQLVDTVASYLPLLDDAKELLAALDVFVAWATVVRESPRSMVCPRVHDATPEDAKMDHPLIQFYQLRHPLVELRQAHYQANSFTLNLESSGMVITGPNMGGKSTFMRSVGVAVVLAQIGCFVPAEAAEVVVRDAVMCRVGATDHLSQGVSTFMLEMLESAAILSHATKDTLAIIDELGRGTSTYDGFGLAWAIAKEIGSEIGATTLLATHFHEMTELPLSCPKLQNYHFGAEVNTEAGTLKFLYQLQPGPCGQSYGLHVATLANMPEEVVENAKRKAEALETFENGTRSSRQPLSKVVETIARDAEVCERVKGYAKRIRSAQERNDSDELKRVRVEIEQDARVAELVKFSPQDSRMAP